MASEPPAGGGGFGTFLIVWIGQLVSVLGSTLAGFVMRIWVFREAGSLTTFALIILSASVPGTLASPLAGPVVDHPRTTFAAAAGWLLPRVRNLEVEIQDGLEEVVR